MSYRLLVPALLAVLGLAPAVAADLRLGTLETPATTREVDYQEYALSLPRALVLIGKDGAPETRDLTVSLVRRHGRWEAAGAQPQRLNKGTTIATIVDPGAGSDALALKLAIGDDQWVKGDPDAALHLKLVTGADGAVTGSYTGTFQGRPAQGALSGRLKRAGWDPGWTEATVAADGAVTLEFGKTRAGWDRARWAVYAFSASTDLSSWDGLRVAITTAEPRTDAWLDVAVMEDDGSWWYVHDAVPLSAANATAVVDFAAMRQAEFVFNAEGNASGLDGNWDEDFRLDTARIRRIAVGHCTGQPVGTVAFTLKGVEPVAWKERVRAPVVASVTGRTIRYDAAETVPGGIFGFHIVDEELETIAPLRVGSVRTCTALGYDARAARIHKPRPEVGVDFYVTGMFDRKQQLPQAGSQDWEATTRAMGTRIGELAKPLGELAVLEWWNEPYLDLGRMLNGFKTLPLVNDQGVKPGDPVVHHGKPLASMVWVEGRMTKDAKGKDRAVFPAVGAPPWRAPEDPAAATGTPTLFAVDPTRFSYWSGRQIGIWYTDLLIALGEEAKKVAPEMQIVGGFGFRWNEDDWGAWDLLYKDMIDRSIHILDGVCEHHYQGYSDGTIATYEVLQAYTDTVHGKRLMGYNTETNDLWDSPARGNAAATSQGDKRFVPARRMVYNLRDLIFCVKEIPDKIAARAIHAKWKGVAADKADPAKPWERAGINEGEWRCLFLLRDLRGRLVRCDSSDPQVWVVASIDPVTKALVTVVYNDAAETREVDLVIAAPTGTTFGDGTTETLAVEADGKLVATSEAVKATAREHRWRVTLVANQARKLALPLSGDLPATSEIVRRQTFAKGILTLVLPGKPMTLPIALPADAVGAARAAVRITVERVGTGEAWVEIGGKRLSIAAAYTPPNALAIREVVIEPALLAGVTTLTFGCAEPAAGGDGWLLCSASVVTER